MGVQDALIIRASGAQMDEAGFGGKGWGERFHLEDKPRQVFALYHAGELFIHQFGGDGEGGKLGAGHLKEIFIQKCIHDGV